MKSYYSCLFWFVWVVSGQQRYTTIVFKERGSQQRYTTIVFEERVTETLENLRAILNQTKSIQTAHEQDHTYDDKYSLVEFATLNTWESLLDAFSVLALNLTKVSLERPQGSSLSLNLDAKTDCSLLVEEEVEVQNSAYRTEVDFNGEPSYSRTERYYRVVTQYKWKVEESYEVYACFASCKSKDRIELKRRTMFTTVTTTSKSRPTECPKVLPTKTVDLGWLINTFDNMGKFRFKIDRNAESCKTPRRNQDIADVLRYHVSLWRWINELEDYLMSIYLPPDSDATNEREAANLTNVILRTRTNWYSGLPLLENSTVLTEEVVELLHTKERQSLANLLSKAGEIFSPAGEDVMVSTSEAFLMIFANHARELLITYLNTIDFVEDMLETQLIRAIGKRITGKDFHQYMQFHSQKFLAESFAPRPFSISVRHGSATPVGLLSIEESFGTGDSYQPAQLITRSLPRNDNSTMFMQIDASTKVELKGNRVLSGWIQYKFTGEQSEHQRLIARARQFSSFILLVGTVTGPNSFAPKAGILLKNKDEVQIPILSEALPSAKEFAFAISSLSPEQQRFAKAFRAMQLESTVFGICLVHLKPQLEKVLHLREGSLAKEIELTETLTSLFMDYQIPPDLLSVEYSSDSKDGVNKLKNYVREVNAIIEKLQRQSTTKSTPHDCSGSISERPNYCPFQSPSASPKAPSASPTSGPVSSPSASPTLSPISSPSASPTSSPVSSPTSSPTESPVSSPSASPKAPSGSPTGTSQTERNENEQESALDDLKSAHNESCTSSHVDFTKIPAMLDAKLQVYDTEGYLRSAIIKTGEIWHLKRMENLLKEGVVQAMDTDSIRSEKFKIFDLLDAITNSGQLAIEASEFHVVMGVSHIFVSSAMETLFKDNINPIEKAEKSMLLFGSEIFSEKAKNMLKNPQDLERLEKAFPNFMIQQ